MTKYVVKGIYNESKNIDEEPKELYFKLHYDESGNTCLVLCGDTGTPNLWICEFIQDDKSGLYYIERCHGLYDVVETEKDSGGAIKVV